MCYLHLYEQTRQIAQNVYQLYIFIKKKIIQTVYKIMILTKKNVKKQRVYGLQSLSGCESIYKLYLNISDFNDSNPSTP